MNNLIDFFERNYQKSIELKKRFSITEKNQWNGLTVLNELSVQIGHVANVLKINSVFKEVNRNFDNIGDEISDIILQLYILIYIEKYDKFHIFSLKEGGDINDLLIVFGQLNEAMLEKYGFRFSKNRVGFKNTDEFIQLKINEMFNIVVNFCNLNNINLQYEYDCMIIDANRFLDEYESRKN